MSNISLKNITKIYDDQTVAVHDLTLDIESKEFVVLVGPSGCGKSTTLRMIAGLEQATSGWIYIDRCDVTDIDPQDRDIAMVFQNYALYPHMTIYENMAFALKLHKISKSEIDKRIQAAAGMLQITNLLKKSPKVLSGGQRQRVAIGRAIVRKPKVFLMDEPLSNLDAKLRNQMHLEMISLRKCIDSTFVYVTHDQIEAMTLGDRIVVMNEGRVQQIGTPSQVFNQPANLFVAGFIGTPQMNFFPATLDVCNKKYVVRFHKLETSVSDEAQNLLSLKKQRPCEIVLGVRPEHFIIAENASVNSISANIRASEMLGSEVYIHADVYGCSLTLRLKIEELPENNWFNCNKPENISFSFCNKNMQLFDAINGKNLIYDYEIGPSE
ncbi:MAG: sn-glycerol-3-phosphate ABC transporter ATP-binding protein UgpC [Syntrophomonadaceae bacterium]|nr:sn-glycerol-3-phosphate ABC transporter ATP-binding protein UgpC [Syntrophomonadaceae bacterium]